MQNLVQNLKSLKTDTTTTSSDEEERPPLGPGPRMDSVREFKRLGQTDAEAALRQELEKLLESANESDKQRAILRKEFEGFGSLFKRYLTSEMNPSIVWKNIHPPPEGTIRPYESLPKESNDTSKVREMLNKLVVLKLNGGLGTSMGCEGPKSIISVRSDLTFLDLTVRQIEALNVRYGCHVPLVLMDSFNTHEETLKIVRKYQHMNVKVYTFCQSRYPRINKESRLPLAEHVDLATKQGDWWYPPGHGDIYQAFSNSGLVEKFLTLGKEFVFASNIDNLGATVDLKILNSLICSEGKNEYVMEVTDKTLADVKGGTLIQYEDKLRLLEIAQVPLEHQDEFKSVSKFKIFNTNNLWIRLDALDRVVKTKSLDMEVIVNRKTLDSGLNVIQLETACGAAIKCFEEAWGVNVPRSRFLPVKTTSDLLLIMSDLYDMTHGCLHMSSRRNFPTTPLVKLGSHFRKVKDFLDRFESIPKLLDLHHLTVSGDVRFGKNVTLKGTVIIIANHGERIDIPSGAILENKIVSGNLRILDH
ncbi:UTP--glucose-1-phosphate uridylyltransferase-like [Oscarella lobularis]|uniref:UTP--glucose-1-phosphate uridylyltransferase-like n=1 Tax=Oscarella lobularis TaxID=121494 RepID=UPI0033133FC1